MEKSLAKKLLWAGWAVSLAVAVICFAMVAQGALRDMRWGEPVIPVDFSQPSDWQSERFRVWGKERFVLFFSSLNNDEDLAGRHLTADFQVQVLGADGNPVFERRYYGERLDHRIPLGYADTRLTSLEIRGRPWRPGTLRVRVREPDPAFRTTHSELKLWRDRRDPGMGGLLNYAMLLPGAVLLLLAMALAGLLAARGTRWPLAVTGLVAIAALGALALG